MTATPLHQLQEVLEQHEDLFQRIEAGAEESVAERFGTRPLRVLHRCRELDQE